MSGRLEEQKWFADFLISEANLYRSRDTLNVTRGALALEPGTLLTAAGGTPAGTGNDVGAILMQAVPAGAGAMRAVCIVRDAEVNDAYLKYGTLPTNAVNNALATARIFVRPGVLAQSIATPAAVEGGSDNAA
jgi:Bacteriophage lambda head decoration protein D